jgi:hypothetical protein
LLVFTALCAKEPFGTCPRPLGYFNYDEIKKLQTSPSRVILIVGRENFSFLSLRWEIYEKGDL